MKHVSDFSMDVFQVGDRYVAEIQHGDGSLDAVLSPVMRGSLAVTDEAARHFALKSFCAQIGDTLRAHLEQLCTQ